MWLKFAHFISGGAVGGVGGVPDNALVLNGEPLELNGETLILGSA